jgi:hypothetical protein
VTFWKDNFGHQLLFVSNKVFRPFSFSNNISVCVDGYYMERLLLSLFY